MLKQLDDSSNDVQSIAVKCLGVLLGKVQEAQVGEICDKLCTLVLEGKDELRDIYSIGLKTLIADVPPAMGPSVCRLLTRRLLSGVAAPPSAAIEIKLECLDNLTDLIRRFGQEFEADHAQIMDTVLMQLSHDKPAVKKRATACLSSLAVVLSDALLNTLTETLLTQIEGGARRSGDVKTLIQTVGTISRTVGYRLGRHLDKVVPLFLRFCGTPDDEELQNESADDLRENCFQGFESFVLRCPREIVAHLTPLTDASMQFLKYDPNYSYDDDDDEMMDGGGDDDDEMDDFDDDEDYGDEEDDTSWKVRRAAIKVLCAVITSRPELLELVWDQCAPTLIGRFKEREENVRIDIIGSLIKLVKVTIACDASRVPGAPAGGAMAKLASNVGAIVAAALKQLGAKPGKADKTKSAIFELLRQLNKALPGPDGLLSGERTPGLMAAMAASLQDKNQQLKLDAAITLRQAIETHPTAGPTFQPHMAALTPLVVALCGEEWYKLIAEGLRLVGVFVTVARPRDASGAFVEGFDHAALAAPLYGAIKPRLAAHDIDQEIKECAIGATGTLVASFGYELGAELPPILALLMERLRNEITRTPTLKALAQIASSPLAIDLAAILSDATTELAGFLRQQSRALKQTTLETQEILVRAHGRAMAPALLETVLTEAAALIDDVDLHLTHLALRVTISVIGAADATGAPIAGVAKSVVLPKALTLAASPLLQGLALSSLLELFGALCGCAAAGLDFATLYGALLERVSGALAKQAVSNLARALATLCAQADEPTRAQSVAGFVADIRGAPDETRRRLALLCVGELGRERDLQSVASLQTIILESFESGEEETKTAAACVVDARARPRARRSRSHTHLCHSRRYALGLVAVGNMAAFLPAILDALETNPRHQYLLLAALKEVIACHTTEPSRHAGFGTYVGRVCDYLFPYADAADEGVRNMVAECLGALLTLHAAHVLPKLSKLAEATGEPGALQKWTVATALKCAMGGDAPVAEIGPSLGRFLALLKDDDLDVQRAALLMVNAAVHHQTALIVGLLPGDVLRTLFSKIEIKLERVVDLGPFKHKVDDGLPLRKAALSCVNTILENCPQQMDAAAFMPFLALGLADKVRRDISVTARSSAPAAHPRPPLPSAGRRANVEPPDPRQAVQPRAGAGAQLARAAR